jgi:hypothetical protein
MTWRWQLGAKKGDEVVTEEALNVSEIAEQAEVNMHARHERLKEAGEDMAAIDIPELRRMLYEAQFDMQQLLKAHWAMEETIFEMGRKSGWEGWEEVKRDNGEHKGNPPQYVS